MKKYHIVTFGCQANLADSERIAKVLESVGSTRADNESKCDLLIFNTCSVRQKAEDRIFGLNKKLRKLKADSRKLITILAGCMNHYPESELRKRLPYIDYFVDSKNINKLPKILGLKTESQKRKVAAKNKYSALIPISYGCDNFCSYCIVPHARGREISRSVKDILKEVKESIAGGGVKEVWLLGQNVNSYQFPDKNSSRGAKATRDDTTTFPALLRLINAIPGDFWIRFTSPHPKDFSDDLIKAMAECEKFAHYINLPVQSGSNAVLKKMNRPYTAGHYKKLIRKIRKAIPDIAISTDIIVGFPGETKKQFEDTVKLMKEIKFDMAFLSEYSPRPKTVASKMEDNVPHKEKDRRKTFLNDEVLAKTALENNKKLLGRTLRVLAADKKENVRTEGYKLVQLIANSLPAGRQGSQPIDKCPIGGFFNIKITKAGPWKLWGEVVENKIIVILGPTSSGKSELAIKLAHKYNGEIISADSRQIYRALNIGSGKVNGQWSMVNGKNTFVYKSVSHHCLDNVSPKKIFSADDFKKCAEKAIKDILSRGKIPIICGGTGFYIDNLLGKTETAQVPPDWKLRKKLEKKSVEELFKMLKKLDPKRAKNIDAKNPRRLIRAIEIAKLANSSQLIANRQSISYQPPAIDYLQIGLKPDPDELKKKIGKRVKGMINPPAGGGLLKEVEKLKKQPSQGGQGLTWKRIYELGFEYKYPAMFLQGKINKEYMLEKMIIENYKYAKRQMTWFKRDKKIKWIKKYSESEKLIKNFLK